MLRRRGVGLEPGLDAVEQVAAPDQVVVAVVIRICAHEQRGNDSEHRERQSDRDLETPRVEVRARRSGGRLRGHTAAAAGSPTRTRGRRCSGGACAASATATPSRVQVSGSSRKAAYISVCMTSAANAAATEARATLLRARLNSRPNAAASSATYSASPITPCSAATVIGIVCDAEVARCADTFSLRRYSRGKEPEPY